MLLSQKEDIMSSLKKKKQQPKLIKLYAFLWHVNVEEMMITEGASGYCTVKEDFIIMKQQRPKSQPKKKQSKF